VVRNLEAEAAYRAAWEKWKETGDLAEKLRLERLMDSLQPSIACHPDDPRWVQFADSLAGYRAFWLAFRQAVGGRNSRHN